MAVLSADDASGGPAPEASAAGSDEDDAWIQAELERELAEITLDGVDPLPTREFQYPVAAWDHTEVRTPPGVQAVLDGRSGELCMYGAPAPCERKEVPRPTRRRRPHSRPETPQSEHEPKLQPPDDDGCDEKWAAFTAAFDRMIKESQEQTAAVAAGVAELQELTAAPVDAPVRPETPPRAAVSPAISMRSLQLSDFSDEKERAAVAEYPEVLDTLRAKWAGDEEEEARLTAEQAARREAAVEREYRSRFVVPERKLERIRRVADAVRASSPSAAAAGPIVVPEAVGAVAEDGAEEGEASTAGAQCDAVSAVGQDEAEERGWVEHRELRDRRAAERTFKLARSATEAALREQAAEKQEALEMRRAEEVAQALAQDLVREQQAREEARQLARQQREREERDLAARAEEELRAQQRRLLVAERRELRAARERVERVTMAEADGESREAERRVAEEARRIRAMKQVEREHEFRRQREALSLREGPSRLAVEQDQAAGVQMLQTVAAGLREQVWRAAGEQDAVRRSEAEERDYVTGSEVAGRSALRSLERSNQALCANAVAAAASMRREEGGLRQSLEEEEEAARDVVGANAAAAESRARAAAAGAATARAVNAAVAADEQEPVLAGCLRRLEHLQAQFKLRESWQGWAESINDGAASDKPRRLPGSAPASPADAAAVSRTPSPITGGPPQRRGAVVFSEKYARSAASVPLARLRRLRARMEDIGAVTGPLSALSSLSSLDLSGNSISEVDGMSELRQLKHLSLRDNALADIEFLSGGPGELRALDISENRLRSLRGIGGAPGLVRLAANGNCIRHLEEAQLPSSLTRLDLHRNNVTDLSPLRNLTSLTSLSAGKNAVSDISFMSHGMPLLQEVQLESNRIRHIPCRLDAVMLKELWLGGNCIESIPDISYCPLLRLLDIRENHVSDIGGVAVCLSLEYLDVSFNRLTDAAATLGPLLPLQRLRSLALNDNPVWEHGGSAAGPGPTELRRGLIGCLESLQTLNADPVEQSERLRTEKSALLPLLSHRVLRMCLSGDVRSVQCVPHPDVGVVGLWSHVPPAPRTAAERNELWALSSYHTLCQQQLTDQDGCLLTQRREAAALEDLELRAEAPEARMRGGDQRGGQADASQPSAGDMAEKHGEQLGTVLAAHVQTHTAPGVGHAQHVWRPNPQYQLLREQHRRGEAALRLTAWARRALARRLLTRRRIARLAAAARVIQPLWRGAVVRQRLARGLWVDDDVETYGTVDASFAEMSSGPPLPSAAMLLAEKLVRSGGVPTAADIAALAPQLVTGAVPQPPPMARQGGGRPAPAAAATPDTPALEPPVTPSGPGPVAAAWEASTGSELDSASASVPPDGPDAAWAQGMARREKKFELIRKRRQQSERAMGLLWGRHEGLDARTRQLQTRVAGNAATAGPAAAATAAAKKPAAAPHGIATPQRAASFNSGAVVEQDVEIRSLTSTVASSAGSLLQPQRNGQSRRAPARLPPLSR
eukprot:TRINITY_DN15363_c0_g1_i2.p1 TRINITY_DN15363_c0_g1~~TRINITY_DN15363_c0_g1_i2.p1  ORF type:complete len:1500 (+),score=512.65 TRINITY_DN15363_c0_g1_i2:47-4501(+)